MVGTKGERSGNVNLDQLDANPYAGVSAMPGNPGYKRASSESAATSSSCSEPRTTLGERNDIRGSIRCSMRSKTQSTCYHSLSFQKCMYELL